MTPEDLVQRWRGSITLATLATWRSRKLGPTFIKVGGRVLYSEEAIADYEHKNRRNY